MTTLLLLAVLTCRGLPQAPPEAAVRLHHLHYRVADPAAEMTRVAAALEGTRVLLQGFGVGVRIGDQYVLFDRIGADSTAPGDGLARTATDVVAAAVAWLGTHGVRVSDPFRAAGWRPRWRGSRWTTSRSPPTISPVSARRCGRPAPSRFVSRRMRSCIEPRTARASK